jgi:hypothetical protein
MAYGGSSAASRSRAAEVGLDDLADLHRPAGDLDPRLVDEDAADVDQDPGLAPRHAGDAAGQHLVEAQALVRGLGGEALGAERH